MPTETILASDALNAELSPAASVGKSSSGETRFSIVVEYQDQSPSAICPSDSDHCSDIFDRTFKEHRTNGKLFTNRLPWGGRDNEWEYRLSQRNRKEGSREALITGE
jgi:hypothetical protein